MTELEQVINGNGVGSHLWRLLEKFGVVHDSECSCILLALLMNDLGPEGCRQNKPHLLKLMKKNQRNFGWAVHVRAGARVVTSRWAFKINPFNPLSSLINLAIKLTEQQSGQVAVRNHSGSI